MEMMTMSNTILTVLSGEGRPHNKALLRLASALTAGAIWLARKVKARRNRNALLELSDDQLKDIGLSRSQAYSDTHVYIRR